MVHLVAAGAMARRYSQSPLLSVRPRRLPRREYDRGRPMIEPLGRLGTAGLSPRLPSSQKISILGFSPSVRQQAPEGRGIPY